VLLAERCRNTFSFIRIPLLMLQAPTCQSSVHLNIGAAHLRDLAIPPQALLDVHLEQVAQVPGLALPAGAVVLAAPHAGAPDAGHEVAVALQPFQLPVEV